MVVRKQNNQGKVGASNKDLVGYTAALGLSLSLIALDAARGISPFSAAAGGAAFLSGYELFSALRDKTKKPFAGRWKDSGNNWEG